MSKKLAVSVGVVVLTLGVVTGYLADAPRSEVPEAFAAVCKSPNGNCGPLVNFKTSTLTVSHVYDPESTNTTVEPDSGESWSITAYWNSPPPVPCFQYTETATVDVDWNGSAWVLSNKTLTANILDIQLCSTDMWCTDLSEDHAYGYKLKVKITDPVPGSYNLRQVVYATSAVDDGYLLNLGSCSLGSSVSPTTQAFSETDSGGFECGFDCDASGPSLVLEYE